MLMKFYGRDNHGSEMFHLGSGQVVLLLEAFEV